MKLYEVEQSTWNYAEINGYAPQVVNFEVVGDRFDAENMNEAYGMVLCDYPEVDFPILISKSLLEKEKVDVSKLKIIKPKGSEEEYVSFGENDVTFDTIENEENNGITTNIVYGGCQLLCVIMQKVVLYCDTENLSKPYYQIVQTNQNVRIDFPFNVWVDNTVGVSTPDDMHDKLIAEFDSLKEAEEEFKKYHSKLGFFDGRYCAVEDYRLMKVRYALGENDSEAEDYADEEELDFAAYDKDKWERYFGSEEK